MKHKSRARASAHSFSGQPARTKSARPVLRRSSGNMLVFITACTIGLLAALAFFGLGYVRLLGSNNEQRTAIEAGSLAAARDLSMIAINTNTYSLNGVTSTCPYGWVSLSDYAPSGSTTIAKDQWDSPVRSINTILGTIRLDLIIADQIGDAPLRTIIKQDLTNALAAQTTLNSALQDAILPSPQNSYTDINGNAISVYTDAQTAYTSNQIRMTGSSSYVAGSLRLTMGCVQNGSTTNIPIPTCGATAAQVPTTSMQSNNYMSYVDIPYVDGGGASTDFVFAGIGTNCKLCDPKQWTATAVGVPAGVQYLSSIVKAEADQHMNSSENANGYTVHAIACAQPANVVDPRPAPGSLSFSFPDGMPPEMTQPADMLNDSTADNTASPPARIFNGASNQAVATFSYSSGGDYPVVTNTNSPTIQDYASWPYPAAVNQTTGNVFRQALYDWWKRAGCKLNVSSAVTMMTYASGNPCTFVPPPVALVPWNSHVSMTDPTIYTITTAATEGLPLGIPNGCIQIYKVDPNTAQVTFSYTIIAPIPYSVVAENQMYSESLGAIMNSSVGQFVVGPFSPSAIAGPQASAYTFNFVNHYDCYIRDQVYRPNDGFHQGEPMDDPTVSMVKRSDHDLGAGGVGCQLWDFDYNNDWGQFIQWTQFSQWGNQWQSSGAGSTAKNTTVGGGKPPILTAQVDFAQTLYNGNVVGYYQIYSTGTGSLPAVRPTYQTNGMAVDVRFRRQVDPIQGTSSILGFSTGYVGDKYMTGTASVAGPIEPAVGQNESWTGPGGQGGPGGPSSQQGHGPTTHGGH